MKTKNIKLLSVLTSLFMAGCTEDMMDDGRGKKAEVRRLKFDG